MCTGDANHARTLASVWVLLFAGLWVTGFLSYVSVQGKDGSGGQLAILIFLTIFIGFMPCVLTRQNAPSKLVKRLNLFNVQKHAIRSSFFALATNLWMIERVVSPELERQMHGGVNGTALEGVVFTEMPDEDHVFYVLLLFMMLAICVVMLLLVWTYDAIVETAMDDMEAKDLAQSTGQATHPPADHQTLTARARVLAYVFVGVDFLNVVWLAALIAINSSEDTVYIFLVQLVGLLMLFSLSIFSIILLKQKQLETATEKERIVLGQSMSSYVMLISLLEMILVFMAIMTLACRNQNYLDIIGNMQTNALLQFLALNGILVGFLVVLFSQYFTYQSLIQKSERSSGTLPSSLNP